MTQLKEDKSQKAHILLNLLESASERDPLIKLQALIILVLTVDTSSNVLLPTLLHNEFAHLSEPQYILMTRSYSQKAIINSEPVCRTFCQEKTNCRKTKIQTASLILKKTTVLAFASAVSPPSRRRCSVLVFSFLSHRIKINK